MLFPDERWKSFSSKYAPKISLMSGRTFKFGGSFLQWTIIWKWYSDKSSFVYTSFALLKTLLRFIIFLWLIIGKTNQTTVSKGNNIFQCKLAVSMNIWTWLQSKWLLCKFSFEFHTFLLPLTTILQRVLKLKYTGGWVF